MISNFFRWVIAAQPSLNSPSSLKFFEMYISIVQVNMGTDHVWLTTWSSVVTGIMISTTTSTTVNVLSLKNNTFWNPYVRTWPSGHQHHLYYQHHHQRILLEKWRPLTPICTNFTQVLLLSITVVVNHVVRSGQSHIFLVHYLNQLINDWENVKTVKYNVKFKFFGLYSCIGVFFKNLWVTMTS